ncbi:polyphosphate kinase 1 [Leptolyngbya sp. FACHB-321]|uniref:polyphosphate kinase 1 n=1 Tax=Leptolyngbya sp. FACHB-321 TaxID=2692807 RepID=UPI001689D1A7|nr:polyphosphate kinase 1 [Leptolyngbya sp. FACHB-321]MBD2034415.1 polyphosphate kinase 1 [Leptolyngbya sp. FACHB-321]
MTRTSETTPEINLSDPQYYFNRELSWLEFNNRVLHEALDPRTPLLERLKFLAIFSTNLDEFFMVRVAILMQRVEAQVDKVSPDGKTPQQQLDALSQQLRPLVTEQHRFFDRTLRPLLAEKGVHILNYMDLNQEQRRYLQHYFEQRVFPILTPLAVDPAHPFPYISSLSLNLAVLVKDPVTQKELFARVKVPNSLPRFITFPADIEPVDRNSVWVGVPLEQIIAHNLELLFPGMNIQEYSLFRITRDADLEIEEDLTHDLLVLIQQELRKRRLGGAVVRLEIEASASQAVRDRLMREKDLTDRDVYALEGLLNLKDLMSLMAIPLPALKDQPWGAAVPSRLRHLNDDTSDLASSPEANEDIFSIIREQDLLVHHPYESFTASVEHFITQAAHDPKVLAIKITLYRTSGDSPIVKALINAAENGKQVAALVELKARFDEENNIHWAQRLEQAGVNVIYGLVGLKTHTKVVLVVREEGEAIRRYIHIGTGNYNSKTAKLYTDLGLFSCKEDLGADLTDLFNFLTGYSRQQSYRKLLVAPVNLRDRMLALIQRETEHRHHGKPGRIIAKMNALVDPQIIATLYAASQAGVEIDLIIRGVCCLRPGVAGVSDNIRVISIVGRFLEHSRIFHFHNNGEEEVFIGSADWMPRNLDRRVEAITPVEEPALAAQLRAILDTLLADNRHAWDLQPDGTYVQRQPAEDVPEHDAQTEFAMQLQQ